MFNAIDSEFRIRRLDYASDGWARTEVGSKFLYLGKQYEVEDIDRESDRTMGKHYIIIKVREV